MNRRTVSLVAVILVLTSTSAVAQWLNYPTPGIPRTPDGKPNLTAPAPKTVDGKPDLSGLWRAAPNTYWGDLIHDIKDEAIFKPEAQAVFRKRAAEYDRDAPYTRCLPQGPTDIFASGSRIIQLPTEVVLLRSGFWGDDFRHIFMDGRKLPKDPNPTWRGYSVGRWEGDTLVVETAGFNDVGWLDQVGHPRSEKLHVTERFQRIDFGHIEFQATFDDPETFTNPLRVSLPFNYQADTEMLESVCEGERDTSHLVGNADRSVHLTADTLAKYAGTYEPPTGRVPRRTFRFTVVDGRLYFGALPLIPQSETRFESLLGNFEFSLDASGSVTGVTYIVPEGAFRAVRTP